jgi:hypothetical protein
MTPSGGEPEQLAGGESLNGLVFRMIVV